MPCFTLSASMSVSVSQLEVQRRPRGPTEGVIGAAVHDARFAIAQPEVIYSPLVEISYFTGRSFDDNHQVASPAP